MRAQHRRRLNVTNGSAKREGEWQGDTGFMRQVLRCGGSIQYFPSDSAPTANQTQMRNTNTCTVAQKLQCNPGIFPSQGFFFLSTPSPPPVALIVHWALKTFGWQWLKGTSRFTILYHRRMVFQYVLGVMMGWDPPLWLSYSWAPPAVGVRCPAMPPCWVEQHNDMCIHGNIPHVRTHTHAHMQLHPWRQTSSINLINTLFHTYLGPCVTHISMLGSGSERPDEPVTA